VRVGRKALGAVTCLLGFAVAFAVGHHIGARPGIGVVVIANQDPIVIARGSVQVCEHHFSFANLMPGDYVVFSHHIDCESGYEVEIQDRAGRAMRMIDGYVTPGLAEVVTVFVIRDGKIQYSKDKSRVSVSSHNGGSRRRQR
jgi:hypothetical protein